MTRSVQPVLRAAAATFLVAAACIGLPAAPATAVGCSSAHGVTVVVDFGEQGGGVQAACVADGGGDSAAQLFTAAGFALTYVQRQPGFVCRVSGKPADDPCVNTPRADAYWGLFWSDGTSGSWSYATTSAANQHVPDGGYAGFSWQGSDTRRAPGYQPAAHPSPSPSHAPTHSPTHAPTNAPTHAPTGPGSSAPTGAPSTTGSPTASASSASPSATGSGGSGPGNRGAGGKRDHPGKAKASSTPSSSGSATATPSSAAAPVTPTSAEPADPAGGGLPDWVAPAAVALLFGAAGVVAVVRRRRGTP